MELPDLEVANELKADMSNFESMWGLYEEFNNGLQELAKEDWISFRLAINPPYLNSSQNRREWDLQIKSLLFYKDSLYTFSLVKMIEKLLYTPC